MAITSSDKTEIKSIIRSEMKSFLDSSHAHDIVIKVIQKELGTKRIDDKIIDLSTKVVVELFKTLWQRKSFWETSIKNVK